MQSLTYRRFAAGKEVVYDTAVSWLKCCYLSAAALVEELRFKGNHAVQFFFGTQRAVDLLKHVEP